MSLDDYNLLSVKVSSSYDIGIMIWSWGLRQ
jgi:hypothetical protein